MSGRMKDAPFTGILEKNAIYFSIFKRFFVYMCMCYVYEISSCYVSCERKRKLAEDENESKKRKYTMCMWIIFCGYIYNWRSFENTTLLSMTFNECIIYMRTFEKRKENRPSRKKQSRRMPMKLRENPCDFREASRRNLTSNKLC